MSRLREHYAEQRRRRDVAGAEWDARGRRLGRFSLQEPLEPWVATLQTSLAAADGGGRAYGATALFAAAVRDGVLTLPEPGELRTAFAHRHPETERETAVGYGFWPASAQELILHAGRAVSFEAFAALDGDEPAVAAGVLRLAHASLDGWRVTVRG